MSPTRRDTLIWSGSALGVLSLGGITAAVVPNQAARERELFERRAAIRAFEEIEDDGDTPSAEIQSETIEEGDNGVTATGTIQNQDVTQDRVAVALRVEFDDDAEYGWTELTVPPGETDEFDVSVETEVTPDAVVDIVPADWHI